MVVSSFAIGALAIPIFELGFVDTALTIIFINILGILPVCFFSTFGPVFGLRQMVLSRFWFGYYGVKISKCFFRLDLPSPPAYMTGSGWFTGAWGKERGDQDISANRYNQSLFSTFLLALDGPRSTSLSALS